MPQIWFPSMSISETSVKVNVGELQRLCVKALHKNSQSPSEKGASNISEQEMLASSENEAAKVVSSVSNDKHSNSLINSLQTQLSIFKAILFCKLHCILFYSANCILFCSAKQTRTDK